MLVNFEITKYHVTKARKGNLSPFSACFLNSRELKLMAEDIIYNYVTSSLCDRVPAHVWRVSLWDTDLPYI